MNAESAILGSIRKKQGQNKQVEPLWSSWFHDLFCWNSFLRPWPLLPVLSDFNILDLINSFSFLFLIAMASNLRAMASNLRYSHTSSCVLFIFLCFESLWGMPLGQRSLAVMQTLICTRRCSARTCHVKMR